MENIESFEVKMMTDETPTVQAPAEVKIIEHLQVSSVLFENSNLQQQPNNDVNKISIVMENTENAVVHMITDETTTADPQADVKTVENLQVEPLQPIIDVNEFLNIKETSEIEMTTDETTVAKLSEEIPTIEKLQMESLQPIIDANNFSGVIEIAGTEMITEETPTVAEVKAPEHHQVDLPQPIIDVKKFLDAAIAKQSNALSLLAQYSGSDSDDDDDDQVTDSVYRRPVSDSSSSSSSDSEEEKDIKVIEKKIRQPVESDGDSDDDGGNKKKKREPLKVKGELSIDELPPIQDLQITVDERECMEIGLITTIVDQLVLVEALQNSVPLDIDSVLFLDHGKIALGRVFDVIGPVSMPIYCVRFNNHDDIAAKGIAIGNKVFCAPRTEHSQFVILSNIMTKGSDASWKNDVEPPENLVDYSDDENERSTKRKNKSNRNNGNGERRGFVQGRRQMPGHAQGQQPNLAYPNYSWHQNIPPPPLPHHLQNFSQPQNYPQQPNYQQQHNYQQQQNYPQY